MWPQALSSFVVVQQFQLCKQVFPLFLLVLREIRNSMKILMDSACYSAWQQSRVRVWQGSCGPVGFIVHILYCTVLLCIHNWMKHVNKVDSSSNNYSKYLSFSQNISTLMLSTMEKRKKIKIHHDEQFLSICRKIGQNVLKMCILA